MLIWLVVPIALGLVGELFSTMFDRVRILGMANKIGGALIGFLKYGFVLGALVWALSAVGIVGDTTMRQSRLCPSLREIPVTVYKILASDDKAT